MFDSADVIYINSKLVSLFIPPAVSFIQVSECRHISYSITIYFKFYLYTKKCVDCHLVCIYLLARSFAFAHP